MAAAGLAGTAVAHTAVAGPPPASPLQWSIDSLVGEDEYPAVTAGVRKDGRTRSLVAGSARLGMQVPVLRDGYVRAGSNTKTFTAVVVLQLVAEGKVRLDEPVET
ncbi:serine hydrolase [Streptomyces sp. NPDC055952]|uniref:serine hydrolase n=1 Tax=Streptomyces sp. NPDC055952 TaxID=3345663 RepID=UPI0035E159C4